MRAVPRLHVITDDARLADARFVDDAAAVLDAGGSELVLHLRGQATTAARLFEVAGALLPVARASGAKVLVNDRVDVALAARADGVQLRERSLDAASARALIGRDALVGVSRHAGSLDRTDGADFVLFGSVYATPSHPERAAAGLEALERAVTTVAPLPVIAIGGVTPVRVGDVLVAGASGVAVLRTVWEGGPAVVRSYLDQLAGLA